MLKLLIRDDEGHETVVPLVRQEITIGRQPGNVVRLTERNVSRRHARLWRQKGTVFLEDLSSANGTQVNGERLQGRVALGAGDRVRIGDYELSIRLEQLAVETPRDRFYDHPLPLLQPGAPPAKRRKSLAVALALLLVAAAVIADQTVFSFRGLLGRWPMKPVEPVAQRATASSPAPFSIPAEKPSQASLAQPTSTSLVVTAEPASATEEVPPPSAPTKASISRQAEAPRKVRESKKASPVQVAGIREKSEPDQAEQLYQQGMEQLRENELNQAVATLNRCLALDPGFANCHRLLGATYARLKDPERGVVHYRRFVELAPDDAEAAKVRIFLEQYEATRGLTKKD